MAAKTYDIPDDCRYTESDEWVRIDDDVAFIGITDYAQSELSDIVYVELPSTGTQLEHGQGFGVVESVKAVGDLYAPLAGEVVRVNKALEETPELVNEDPYGRGWIIALAIGVMTVVGLAAGLVPAWRAARIDPSVTLRAE